jgi:hypothetical protein
MAMSRSTLVPLLAIVGACQPRVTEEAPPAASAAAAPAPTDASTGGPRPSLPAPVSTDASTGGPRPSLPAPEPPPPSPTVAPPLGTPETLGAILQILAVDSERAVVVFTPHTGVGRPGPTLALMRRSGAIEWVANLPGTPLAGRTSSGIELVGDAVSVAIARAGRLHEQLERIDVYALDDGRRRAVIEPGDEYYGRDTVVDRGERYDVLLATGMGPSIVIASDARGERWRAPLHAAPGPEVIVLPEHLVVHERDEGGKLWRVYTRATGRAVAGVRGWASCSDGQRWFVLDGNTVERVDLRDFSTDVVLDVDAMPGEGDEWYARDCTIIDDHPVGFVQRGMIESLVDNGAGGHIVPLGIRRYREGAIDPLPDRLHPIVALTSLDDEDFYDLVVTDVRRPSAAGEPRRWVGVQGSFAFDDGAHTGYVVATRGVIAVIDGERGEIVGHHIRRDTMALNRSQRVGTHLWLPPAAPLQLGRAAPTVLDLAAPPADLAVRAAIFAELTSGTPAGRCDSMDTIDYDGVGTTEGLGPVSPSRLPPWDVEHFAASARRFACASEGAKVVLLAWSIVEDSRPLRLHDALALVEDTRGGAPIYTVLQMSRQAKNPRWNISVSFHDPSSPMRRFAVRPTTADLDAFVEQSRFRYVDGWAAVLAGNVLDSEWIAVTGEPPTVHFGAGIEQTD